MYIRLFGGDRRDADSLLNSVVRLVIGQSAVWILLIHGSPWAMSRDATVKGISSRSFSLSLRDKLSSTFHHRFHKSFRSVSNPDIAGTMYSYKKVHPCQMVWMASSWAVLSSLLTQYQSIIVPLGGGCRFWQESKMARIWSTARIAVLLTSQANWVRFFRFQGALRQRIVARKLNGRFSWVAAMFRNINP